MDVRDYIEASAAGFFATLKQWLAIPSISADPAHHEDVARSAAWLAAHLRETGFPLVEIWPTGEPGAPGRPAVYAEWRAAAETAPTVLVYGHHDVQPVEPRDAWVTDPFSPVERGQQLLGRGASDDKGQVLFHTLGVRAWLAASGDSTVPPVTLKLLIEGEEESGSPNFAGLLRRERERLTCDVIVVSDTPMWTRDVPSMCTGMRGMTDGQIDLYGPASDLHSGSFGGRPAAVRRAGMACERGRFQGGGRRRRLLHAGADLGAPNRRDQRHVGRVHRAWSKDDHPY